VECTSLAKDRKDIKVIDGKSFPKRFEAWRENIFDLIPSLILYTLHPFTTNRFETHFLMITIEDLPKNIGSGNSCFKMSETFQTSFKEIKGKHPKEYLDCVIAILVPEDPDGEFFGFMYSFRLGHVYLFLSLLSLRKIVLQINLKYLRR
jgi:hypothetical protein